MTADPGAATTASAPPDRAPGPRSARYPAPRGARARSGGVAPGGGLGAAAPEETTRSELWGGSMDSLTHAGRMPGTSKELRAPGEQTPFGHAMQRASCRG